MSKEYKNPNGCVGPGGVRCSCCTPGYIRNPKKIKQFINRIFRRKSKKILKEEEI